MITRQTSTNYHQTLTITTDNPGVKPINPTLPLILTDDHSGVSLLEAHFQSLWIAALIRACLSDLHLDRLALILIERKQEDSNQLRRQMLWTNSVQVKRCVEVSSSHYHWIVVFPGLDPFKSFVCLPLFFHFLVCLLAATTLRLVEQFQIGILPWHALKSDEVWHSSTDVKWLKILLNKVQFNLGSASLTSGFSAFISISGSTTESSIGAAIVFGSEVSIMVVYLSYVVDASVVKTSITLGCCSTSCLTLLALLLMLTPSSPCKLSVTPCLKASEAVATCTFCFEIYDGEVEPVLWWLCSGFYY